MDKRAAVALMEEQDCTQCKRMLPVNEFEKNGRLLRTCARCRALRVVWNATAKKKLRDR